MEEPSFEILKYGTKLGKRSAHLDLSGSGLQLWGLKSEQQGWMGRAWWSLWMLWDPSPDKDGTKRNMIVAELKDDKRGTVVTKSTVLKIA